MTLRSAVTRNALPFVLACSLAAHGLSASSAAAAPSKRRQQQQCISAAETGQQLRSAGKLRDARRAFGPCTSNACASAIRRDCGRWVDEIDSAMPSFTVKLVDESGADVSDGRILVDGEALLRAADGHATPIDPGMHRFVWARDAGNVETDVVVREGEHNRVIVLSAPTAAPSGPPAPEPHAEAPPRSPLPWVVGTAGAVLLVGGGVFWGIGLHDRANLDVTCAGAHSCAQSDVDASRTKLIVGDVLVGVGVLAVAGAVYLFLRQPRGSTSTASR